MLPKVLLTASMQLVILAIRSAIVTLFLIYAPTVMYRRAVDQLRAVRRLPLDKSIAP